MRYQDRTISYSVSKYCNQNQKLDSEMAFSIISEKTILKFNKLENTFNFYLPHNNFEELLLLGRKFPKLKLVLTI